MIHLKLISLNEFALKAEEEEPCNKTTQKYRQGTKIKEPYGTMQCTFLSHLFFVFFPHLFFTSFLKKISCLFSASFFSRGISFHSFIFIIMPHLVNVGLRGPSVICGGLKIIHTNTHMKSKA